MEIKKTEVIARAIKFEARAGADILGRAYLYLIKNDLHANPYGLLEDIFVNENFRGQGTGNKLVEAVISEARVLGCTKLIANSRHSRENIHAWYERLGFKDYGKEFRMDF